MSNPGRTSLERGKRLRYDRWRIHEHATTGGIRTWDDKKGAAISCERGPSSCHFMLSGSIGSSEKQGRSTPESCVCKAVASGK